MAAGLQPTVLGINSALTANAVAMRQLMQEISNLNLQVSQQGLTGLTGIGYSAADAQSVISMAALMNNVAAVYFGTATQATANNYNTGLAPLWAGQ